MNVRSMTELFTLAERARETDDFAQGAVGAAGYGFALANEVESKRLPGGGSKLINLSRHLKDSQAAACALTLTSGAMSLGSHSEELLQLGLLCVAPDGAQDVVRFYVGPSGPALSTGEQLRFEHDGETDGDHRARFERLMEAAQSVVAAWESALRRVNPTSFAISVDSDFGESVTSWPPRTKGQPANPSWAPSFPLLDTSQAEAALAAARGVDPGDGAACCRAIEQIEAARGYLSEEGVASTRAGYDEVAARIWLPALAHLERELETSTGFELPREVELLIRVLPYPKSPNVQVSRERRFAVSELAERVWARRWAARPWRL